MQYGFSPFLSIQVGQNKSAIFLQRPNFLKESRNLKLTLVTRWRMEFYFVFYFFLFYLPLIIC